jgi:hypothetical protein
MADTLDQHLDYAAVLHAIREWPIEERLALMHDILRTLPKSGVDESARQSKRTWKEATGLLAGTWPTPTDADVERLLDEYRAEKHC